MKVVIDDLNETQAEAMVKAIMYHLNNEGIDCTGSSVGPAKTYKERMGNLLPEKVIILIQPSGE